MLFRRPLLAILFLICTAVLLCGVSGYQLMTHTLGGGACCGPLCRGGETVWGPQLRQKMRPPAQPAAQLARQALPGPGRRVSGAGQVRLRASADASGEAAIAAQVKRDLEFYEKITAVEDEALRAATISALDTLAQALRLYGPANTVVSFNGGKDADVVYFEDPKEFADVEAHVSNVVERHRFEVLRYSTGVKAGLAELVEQRASSLAFVLGTRQGDPNCGEQGSFAPSSSYMPAFMRVNPVITWTYGQIWQFINTHHIPVCRLYQEGYTSLGKVDNTAKNPALRQADGSYLPAWQLSDWSLERAGRLAPAQSPGTGSPGRRSMAQVESRLKAATNVGLVVIGDEVLQGKVHEENSNYAISALRARGMPIHRIAFVRDNEAEIAAELVRQSAACDIVLSSGGIGPTHDDVTLKAVASAFGTIIEEDANMMALLPALCKVEEGQELSEAQRRFAQLPRGGNLLWPRLTKAGDWPIYLYDNIFVLPGVPQFFKKKLDTIIDNYMRQRKVVTARARVAANEPSLVSYIDAVVAAFPTVKIGSYPVNAMADTVVTFEWMEGSGHGCAEDVMDAARALEAELATVSPPPSVTLDDVDTI